jgi:hypothetical protein
MKIGEWAGGEGFYQDVDYYVWVVEIWIELISIFEKYQEALW